MTIQAYLSTVGAAALSLVAISGCTVNSTTNNNATDGAADMDSSTGAVDDTGTTDTGTALVDSGTVPPAEAGPDAASCSVAASTTSPTCDTCVESMCCAQLEACFGTGASAAPCVALTSCMQDCEAGNADAGLAPQSQSDCLTNVCAADGGGYSATDQANSIALLACLGDGDAGANLCGSACGTNAPAVDAGGDSGGD